jgi:two-component system, OmpR family, phosphate regulon sensor histidine kinase PhoR
MPWFSAVFNIVLLGLAGAVLGLIFGNVTAGIIIALSAVLLYWSIQLWRLQQWLANSELPPPDIHGVLGEIVSRIYKHQRESGDNQKRLQSLVDYLLQSFASMRDAVIIVEESGGIRWCNEAALGLLGLRHPQDMGQAITNLVRYPEFIEYVNAGNYEEPLDFSTDGDHKLHLQMVVTRFAEGDRLLFVRDVSVKVKTDEMRRDFVGNVSHELRTPLTVITGYLGNFLLDEENLPPGYKRAFGQMVQQSERMENLLKDLLWLSRIESTEQQAKNEPVELSALLDELLEELGNTHPGRRLTLDVSVRARVVGDYRELYSAVSNLVLNAFKYSDEDSEVVVSLKPKGAGFVLAVKDSGIGIDAIHFSRLTERFYRVDDSRSTVTGGTGLGLAIAKHVAVAHGAQLSVDSSPGKGSIFSLDFPNGEISSIKLIAGENLASGG